MADVIDAELSDGGRVVALARRDGTRLRFHAEWLRDNAPDPATRAPGNGQRLITLADIPSGIRVREVRLLGDGALELAFDPGCAAIAYSIDWLLDNAYDRPAPHPAGWLAPEIQTWDWRLADALPVARFDDIRDDRASLGTWLAAVRRHGFALLRGGPVASGAVIDVASLFGYVRETNYGRMFDVRTEVDPGNLANTGLGLQAHTDNPYRDPVPTLQLLYCLRSSAGGGDSLVVDGFHAAHRLAQEQPEGFRLLATHCARFEYAGESGVRLRARRPIVELAPDGELIAIRFNNRSAAALTDVPFDRMAHYYAAYRRFAELIDDPAMAVTFRLAPGECLIVDNTRVLHGRTAYDGAASRWLQGCYADKDGLLSTLAVIESEVRAETS